MKVVCYIAGVDYGWKYIIPSIEYRHKYWYLWEIAISWWTKSVVIALGKKKKKKIEL